MIIRLICVALLASLLTACQYDSSQNVVDSSGESSSEPASTTHRETAHNKPADATATSDTSGTTSLEKLEKAPEKSDEKPVATLEQKLMRAQSKVQSDPSAAIELLDEVLAEQPDHRRALLLSAQAIQQHAITIIQVEEKPDEGYPMFFRAAERMRRLAEKNENLSRAEKEWLGLALYNEACAFAIAGDEKQALASLNSSVEAGYRDAAHTESDEDLKSVRDSEEFQKLLEQMKDSD